MEWGARPVTMPIGPHLLTDTPVPHPHNSRCSSTSRVVPPPRRQFPQLATGRAPGADSDFLFLAHIDVCEVPGSGSPCVFVVPFLAEGRQESARKNSRIAKTLS